jgi:hypothetical protein
MKQRKAEGRRINEERFFVILPKGEVDMKFCYRTGQRPLDGFTIKRGIGKGGFGEVYFAVSDGGKEVALKLVRSEGLMELRGVAHCLNLKHPNLVALYDLKTDGQGGHWVVMEYVAGEPLSLVLSRHPTGVPRELVREWFIGIARAIAYLHDHGIVHRDLKPGNIFLENGMVKIGDYGLSKSISTSQRTGQTQSVGTVHYMAPEISTGNYNKQIDIYAAGIILYEMLTGRVPFEGESCGEILMKHLTQAPDLSKLPAEYVPILAKALAKNPAQRYGSMVEMARAVESLGMQTKAAPAPVKAPAPLPVVPPAGPIPAETPRSRVMELCGSMGLTVLVAALATTLWAAVTRHEPGDWHNPMTGLARIFFLVVLTVWAVLVPAKFWSQSRSDSWTRRVVMLLLGGVVGLTAFWLDGWKVGEHGEPEGSTGMHFFPGPAVIEAAYFSYYGLAFFAIRWWRMAARRRSHRFSFAPILAAAFWALVLMGLVPPHHTVGVLVLAMAAAVIQLVSPWEAPPPPAAKRLRLRYA